MTWQFFFHFLTFQLKNVSNINHSSARIYNIIASDIHHVHILMDYTMLEYTEMSSQFFVYKIL